MSCFAAGRLSIGVDRLRVPMGSQGGQETQVKRAVSGLEGRRRFGQARHCLRGAGLRRHNPILQISDEIIRAWSASCFSCTAVPASPAAIVQSSHPVDRRASHKRGFRLSMRVGELTGGVRNHARLYSGGYPVSAPGTGINYEMAGTDRRSRSEGWYLLARKSVPENRHWPFNSVAMLRNPVCYSACSLDFTSEGARSGSIG